MLARDISRLPVKLPLVSFTNTPFILLVKGESNKLAA